MLARLAFWAQAPGFDVVSAWTENSGSLFSTSVMVPSPLGTSNGVFPVDSLCYARGSVSLCQWFCALSRSSPPDPSFPADAFIASSSKAGSPKASVVAVLSRRALDRQLLRAAFVLYDSSEFHVKHSAPWVVDLRIVV